MTNYYKIYLNMLELQSNSHLLIREVIRKIDIKDMDNDAKLFLMAAIAHKVYSNNPSSIAPLIKEAKAFSGIKERIANSSISQVGLMISGIDNRAQFNTLIRFAAEMSKYYSYHSVHQMFITLFSGNISLITSKVVNSIDFEGNIKKQIAELVPNFEVHCSLCGKKIDFIKNDTGDIYCDGCRRAIKSRSEGRVNFKSEMIKHSCEDIINSLREEKAAVVK